MYSEHKNAGKGRLMLTFKRVKATDPSFLKIDTWKDYTAHWELFGGYHILILCNKTKCVCSFKSD